MNYENLHQGSELDNNRFIALICDRDDIKGKAKELNIKLNEEQLNKVYERLQNKLADMILEDGIFWDAITEGIEEVKSDE